jgi:hypothetical protein
VKVTKKKAGLIGGLVVAAGLAYSATRTKRGTRARRSVGKKARRVANGAKSATRESVTRVQGVLGRDVESAGHKVSTGTKKD